MVVALEAESAPAPVKPALEPSKGSFYLVAPQKDGYMRYSVAKCVSIKDLQGSPGLVVQWWEYKEGDSSEVLNAHSYAPKDYTHEWWDTLQMALKPLVKTKGGFTFNARDKADIEYWVSRWSDDAELDDWDSDCEGFLSGVAPDAQELVQQKKRKRTTDKL